MSATGYKGVTWEEAWELLNDIELAASVTVDVRVWPPRQGKGGVWHLPRVAVTCERQKGGAPRPLTRICSVGGRGGARTYPAALVRALHELAAMLEEEARVSAAQAAF